MDDDEERGFDTWLRDADADLTAAVVRDLDAERMLIDVKRRAIRTVAGRSQRVFLSFTPADRTMAERLGEDLRKHGIDTFINSQGDPRGLGQFDYYVLLWSRAAVDRPGIHADWIAALGHEVRARRSFLFIVQLDRTQVPAILAARKCIDASDNWTAAVDQLVRVWRQDRVVGLPVLPAPMPTASDRHSTVELYVRIPELSVVHVIHVPARLSLPDLKMIVEAALALPKVVVNHVEAVEVRFNYHLTTAGELTPGKFEVVNMTDGAIVDLEVMVQVSGSPVKESQSLVSASLSHLCR